MRRSSIDVAYGRSIARVRLAAMRTHRDDGRRRVSLADVWRASPASAASDVDALRFDFVGEDGFDTSCKRGDGLPGLVLCEGLLDLETRDLVWSVELPCFYRVKGVVTMKARARVTAPAGS